MSNTDPTTTPETRPAQTRREFLRTAARWSLTALAVGGAAVLSLRPGASCEAAPCSTCGKLPGCREPRAVAVRAGVRGGAPDGRR